MEFLSVILAQRSQLCVSPALLARLNAQGAPYGLSLSMGDLHALSDCRTQALQNTGRIEFGEGILEKIVAAFADSPYLFQEEYAEALARLQEINYLEETVLTELARVSRGCSAAPEADALGLPAEEE